MQNSICMSIGRAITCTNHRDLNSGEPIKFWVGVAEAQNGDTCDAVAGADESKKHLLVSELRKTCKLNEVDRSLWEGASE